MITQCYLQKVALTACMPGAFFGINLGLVGGIYIHTKLQRAFKFSLLGNQREVSMEDCFTRDNDLVKGRSRQ